MRYLRNVGLAALVLAMSASTSFAQRSVNTGAGAGAGGFWEFGLDFVGLNFGMDDPSTTSFDFGSGSLRAGKYLTNVISIEPQVVFAYQSTSGGGSDNDLGVLLGVLYHLQSDRTTQQWYVRPLVIFTRSSNTTAGGTTTINNRSGLGVGFGVKRPSKKNSRFTWRAEATYTSMTKPSESDLNIGGGISIYTR